MMNRLGGLALALAASLALAACGSNPFGSAPASSSAPAQPGYQYNSAHDVGMPGPGTHDNRE